VLKLGEIEYKTNIIERTLNPMWNEEFYFELKTPSDLTIELFDWDRLSSHDRMGVVVVQLNSLSDEKMHAESFHIVPYKREKVSGDLFLRVQYTSPQNAQKNYQIARLSYDRLVQVIVSDIVS
jgi:Ca2+-dependent lipid-binding protein